MQEPKPKPTEGGETGVSGVIESTGDQIVADGETGMLVPSRDAQAMAKALKAAIADSTRRKKIGDAAFRRARDQFSMDAMVDGHLAFYEKVIRD